LGPLADYQEAMMGDFYADQAGLCPSGGWDCIPTVFTARGTLISAQWECAAFSWSADPRTEPDRWRAERQLIPQAAISVPAIDFQFGSRGPKGLAAFKEVAQIAPGPNKFGMVCVSTIQLPQGRWRVVTTSDDGIRVLLTRRQGEKLERTTLIENWTWHAPTVDTATFTQPAEGEVNFMIEYFQLDGHAVLKFDLTAEP
jgi:hypothetical protein